MSDNTKYITDYSWRTIVSMVIFLPTANTYRVSVSPIDVGEPGALSVIQEGFLLVDNAGHIFPIIAVGVGTIDVEDRLLCGEYPVTGMVGIVCKTANKGNSIYIPQGQLNYLDKTAQQYIDSVVWSVLWANDTNALRIPFTATNTPTIQNYQSNQVINGTLVNLAENYGINPHFLLMITVDANTEQPSYQPPILNYVDGLLDSIVWEWGEEITGYIKIFKT